MTAQEATIEETAEFDRLMASAWTDEQLAEMALTLEIRDDNAPGRGPYRHVWQCISPCQDDARDFYGHLRAREAAGDNGPDNLRYYAVEALLWAGWTAQAIEDTLSTIQHRAADIAASYWDTGRLIDFAIGYERCTGDGSVDGYACSVAHPTQQHAREAFASMTDAEQRHHAGLILATAGWTIRDINRRNS